MANNGNKKDKNDLVKNAAIVGGSAFAGAVSGAAGGMAYADQHYQNIEMVPINNIDTEDGDEVIVEIEDETAVDPVVATSQQNMNTPGGASSTASASIQSEAAPISQQPTQPGLGVSIDSVIGADVAPINPNEVSANLIVEEIDPTDIEAPDIYVFESIETLYTEDGDIVTAAAFTDDYGDEYMMVDVDGDNVFDFVVDDQLNYVGYAPNLTVDDAELMVYDDNTYLAADDTTPSVMDDFHDDIITT